jgi:ADP-ribose pyrophosphatase YjhB (NUDIX family)
VVSVAGGVVTPGVFPVDVRVLVVSDRRVLLLRETRVLPEWVLPSAGLANGESVDDACGRALAECLGVTVGPGPSAQVVHLQHEPAGGGRLALYVWARGFTGVPSVADRTRFDLLEWRDPRALPVTAAAAVAAGVAGWAGQKWFSVFPARPSRRLGLASGGGGDRS